MSYSWYDVLVCVNKEVLYSIDVQCIMLVRIGHMYLFHYYASSVFLTHAVNVIVYQEFTDMSLKSVRVLRKKDISYEDEL